MVPDSLATALIRESAQVVFVLSVPSLLAISFMSLLSSHVSVRSFRVQFLALYVIPFKSFPSIFWRSLRCLVFRPVPFYSSLLQFRSCSSLLCHVYFLSFRVHILSCLLMLFDFL